MAPSTNYLVNSEQSDPAPQSYRDLNAMDKSQIAIGVAILSPAVFALAALVFYMVRYLRLRRGRKDTWADYLHDFAGGWTRLIAHADRPEEQHYFRKMLIAGAVFVAYVSFLMAVVGSS
jgi:hypothetical protein